MLKRMCKNNKQNKNKTRYSTISQNYLHSYVMFVWFVQYTTDTQNDSAIFANQMSVDDNQFVASDVYDYWIKNSDSETSDGSIIPTNKHLTESSQICLCFDFDNHVWLFGWIPNPYDFDSNTEQDIVEHMYKNNNLVAVSSMQHFNFNNGTNKTGNLNINVDIEDNKQTDNQNGIEDNVSNISPLTIVELPSVRVL